MTSERTVRAPEPQERRNVHTEHCCKQHGCKYGSPDCPVETGEKRQSYDCEYCDPDEIMARALVEEAEAWVAEQLAKQGSVTRFVPALAAAIRRLLDR